MRHTRFWSESFKEINCIQYLNVNLKIILKRYGVCVCVCVYVCVCEWNNVVQDRDHGRAAGNTIMNSRVP